MVHGPLLFERKKGEMRIFFGDHTYPYLEIKSVPPSFKMPTRALMTERVPAVPWRNGFLGQVEQEFSSFFAKFLPNLMIFLSGL